MTLNRIEFEEKLKSDIGCVIRAGFMEKGDVFYPVDELYEINLDEGYFEVLKRINEVQEEAVILDSLLENPKESDLVPLMFVENGVLVPHIYAHAKGKYICRVKKAEGDLNKAEKNLKKKFPLKTYTRKGVTALYTDSPYLAASHLLIQSFPEDYTVVPHQGIIYLIPPEEDMDKEEELKAIERAMLLSGSGFNPPAMELNYIEAPKK